MVRRLVVQSGLTRRAVMTSCLGVVGSIGLARAGSGHEPWSIATALPFAVQEIYPTAFGDHIVLAGGIVDDPQSGLSASARTVVYQPRELVWADGPSLPIALHHPGLVALPDQVMMMGGFVANNDGFWQMCQFQSKNGPLNGVKLVHFSFARREKNPLLLVGCGYVVNA